MKVRANAETPADARVARSFGAEGIGLCRTEHMFFDGERIVAVREMILADTEQGRRAALAKLLPMQRQDFAELFEIMTGLPVTIRLLDPPLHEFLPKTDEEVDEVAKAMKVSADKLRARSAELHEFNPMLGFRGVRLAIRYPEIAEMQARAIFEGAVQAGRKTGEAGDGGDHGAAGHRAARSSTRSRRSSSPMGETVAKETGVKVPYQVGTMIELPRAALRAGEIAESAEFFSFGTNDLTQTTLGVSRDDAASFLGMYTVKGLLKTDPFVTLDTEGVGELITIACERGRATRPDIKLGVCGEHGGDPASIAFCEGAHLDYVSCSPFRIPIARLAAAQAALGGRRRARREAGRSLFGDAGLSQAVQKGPEPGEVGRIVAGRGPGGAGEGDGEDRVEREASPDRRTRLIKPAKRCERGRQHEICRRDNCGWRRLTADTTRPPARGCQAGAWQAARSHPGVGQHVPWTEAQGLGDVRFGFFGAADENLTESNGGMSVGEISIQRQRVFAFGDALGGAPGPDLDNAQQHMGERVVRN